MQSLPRAAVLASALALACQSASAQETPLERGRYLMEGIVACGNCHTTLNAQGEPVEGKQLAGRLVIELPQFTAYAPNITPDKETGIGNWTDEQIIAAIREGRRPDGSIIGPPMPVVFYRRMSDSDVKAIVAYLRSIPAVSNKVPKSTYNIPLPPNWGPPVESIEDPDRSDKIGYGAYLAGPLGHCLECHTPMSKDGHPDFENQLGAGGFVFKGPWGTSVSANITPHPDGIADMSAEEVKAAIVAGIGRGGRHLLPPMPFNYYRNIKVEDLDAIVAYLRTLPPKPDGE